MADDKAKVSFEGDASGVEQAAAQVNRVITDMRARLQAQQGSLNGFARAWAGAFGIPANGQQAKKFLDDLGTKADQTRGKVSGLDKTLAKLGTGAGLAILAKQTADMADVWTRSRNLLSATGIATSDLAAKQSELVGIAIQTRTALEPTVSLYTRMARAVVPLGHNLEEVARATTIVNMAFKAGGAAVSEQNAAILQLSQALGAGALQGDELRSVRENAPLIAKAIANEFKTSIAGLKDLGAKGQLETDRVFKAIIEGGKDIERQFSTTIPTIQDSFNNLRTRIIEYIGNANEATGSSKLLSGVINLVANNINLLMDALVVVGTIMAVNFARNAAAAMIAQLIQIRAQMIAVNVMFAATPAAANAAAGGIFRMSVAVGVLRGALAALMGPVGIVLAIGAALGFMATQASDATDEIEKLRQKYQALVATTEAFDAKLQEIQERDANKMIGDFGDLNGQIETAAQRTERLKKVWEELDAKEFDADLKKINESINGFQSMIFNAELRWQNLTNGAKGDPENIRKYREELAQMNKDLAEATRLRDALLARGDKGYSQKGEKDYIQAVYDEYEFKEFAARNNQTKLIQILQEKAEVAKRLYGDESQQYIRAVREKEQAEEQLARKTEQSARERARAEKDANKDIMEGYDTQLEANEDNRSESERIMSEKLAFALKAYGEESREYQRTLQEQIRMRRKFQNEENALVIESMQRDQQVREGHLNTELSLIRSGLEQKRAVIDAGLQRGLIDETQAAQLRGALAAQEIQAEINHERELYNVAMTGLQARLKLDGLRPEQRQQILNEMVIMENAFNDKMAELANQQATNTQKTQIETSNAVANSWDKILQPVGGAINGMFQNLYNGTMGWKDSFLQALDNILFSFVDMGIQMATQWAANQLTMTAATTAGAATRTAAETTAATATQSMSATTALGQILNYAWTAAAGAFSAMAGIPYIGPILAVAAGAAAVAAVMGFAGNLFSAEGGFGSVPADGTITELHKEEMVLPAKFANPLRNMLGGFGMPNTPGTISATAGEAAEAFRQQNNSIKEGDTNLYYSPQTNVNNVSLGQLLRRDGLAMKKWLKAEMRQRPGGKPKVSA